MSTISQPPDLANPAAAGALVAVQTELVALAAKDTELLALEAMGTTGASGALVRASVTALKADLVTGTVPVAQLPAAVFTKSVNAQTGTTYVLAAADSYEQGTALITLTNANPITVTVPKNSAVAIAVGQSFNCQQIGAGQVTFAPVDGDVTINPAATLTISAQWKAATLVKTATNVWSIIGSLSA
jgi:hypothetical protein